MYPTKSMLDYMTEMHRLFPRNSEHDLMQSSPTSNSSLQSFNQSSLARSSSSTDTSPDSFPDMSTNRYSETYQQFDLREYNHHRTDHNVRHRDRHADQFLGHQYDSLRMDHRFDQKPEMVDVPFMPQMYDTPCTVRRQRPIIGRKILPSSSQIKSMDEVSNMTWPEDLLTKSPNLEQNFDQNVFYELFPTENKETEFRSPVKMSPNTFTSSPRMPTSPTMTASPILMNTSPRMINTSPRMINTSPRMANISPRMNMFQRVPEMSIAEMSCIKTSPESSTSYPQRLSTPFKEPIMGPSASSWSNSGSSKMCTFCRKNGETPLVYMTHTVKEKVGNKNVVTCPILRSHVCSTCGATGDNAHTITYCPILRSTNNGQPLRSTTITLKNTRVKSNGRRRY